MGNCLFIQIASHFLFHSEAPSNPTSYKKYLKTVEMDTFQISRTRKTYLFSRVNGLLRSIFSCWCQDQVVKNPWMLVLELISCMQHSEKLKRRECMCAKPVQSGPTLRAPVDCRLPGFSIHGILQKRTLEWVAMPSFRGSSWLSDWTHISCISWAGRQLLYH